MGFSTPSSHSFDTGLQQRLAQVIDNIHQAATRYGRDPADIRLIAVSKTQSLAQVQAALAAGQKDFGENTLQDARSKIDALPPGTGCWHFIGHLQSNKVKYIPGRFQWLHTLDSISLAQKLEARLQATGASISALIQVNVTADPKKHGIPSANLDHLIEKLVEMDLKAIKLSGLMTIGRQSEDSTKVRAGFATLRDLCARIREVYGLEEFKQLSMGMSGDFREAIAEGSTMVRIGTAIFGARKSA